MKLFPLILFFLFLFVQCVQSNPAVTADPDISDSQQIDQTDSLKIIDTSGMNILKRFNVPVGYKRVECVSQQFGYYLRNLPLKPAGSKVRYFDSTTKEKSNVYAAVVDLPIGKRDLHQCADAVMRLRAEYLWEQGRYDDIHFNYTRGFRAEYTRWMNGDRIAVEGNKVYYKKVAAPSNTPKDLWNFLEQVFTYCGTLSLSRELKPVEIRNIEPGDVFIKGGSPGHAVIVLDVAKHTETGKKIFLLGQSYMPAQEIQVLVNPMSPDMSPWYSEDFGQVLNTPEWTFFLNELKRF